MPCLIHTPKRFAALVGTLYLTIVTFPMVGFCKVKFSLPYAASRSVLTVNLQLVDVANYSPVWEVIATQIFAAMWTLAINHHTVFQALLAENLPTAAGLLGLPRNQNTNDTDVVIL